MKFYKILILFFTNIYFLTAIVNGQSNPYIGLLPTNSGLVALGATLDIEVTIGNTGSATIAVSKLRPIIQVPVSVIFLANGLQTGLPAGWSILSNTGSQLRLCNSGDAIPGATSRIIILKVQGVTIAPPTSFVGNINFGNGTTCAAGPAVAGDNTADNSAASSIEVVAGCSLNLSTTVGTILCNGGTTTLTALTTAASGPVEYAITGIAGYQTSNTFNVSAGTYTLTAREVNNPTTCKVSVVVVITEPSIVLSPAVNITQPTCTVATGTVIITSTTADLTFSIDGSNYTTYPTNGYILNAGTYNLTAKNINNCTSISTNIIINTPPIASTAPLVGIVTQPNCSVSTGAIELINLPTEQWIIQPGNISGNTNSVTINNVTAGTYSYTLTNTYGCISLPSAAVTINIVTGAPALTSINITQPTCTESTGSIAITSPTTNLTFSIDGNPFNNYPSTGYTNITSGNHTLIAQNISGCLSPVTNFTINQPPTSPTAPTLSIIQPTCTVSTATINVLSNTIGLTFSIDGGSFITYPIEGFIVASGIHTLAVQNLSGCAPNITNNILVLPQPITPSINVTSTLITCFGNNSTLTATANGGILPYQFSLNNQSFQNSNTFTVPAGTYTVLVKDFNGCIGTTANILITQPAAISAALIATPIVCNGGNSTLTIFATGGLGALEYSLNNGPFKNTNNFIVPAGTYTAVARLIDNPTCSTTVINTLAIAEPLTLKATSTAPAIRYCGGTTVIEVKATGGKVPYSGTGNFVRGPGTWNFTVVDSNSCSQTTEITILPPGCLELKAFPNPAVNNIQVYHSAAIIEGATILVYASNGVRVLQHNVAANSFLSTIDIKNIANGIYMLIFINGDEKKEIKFLKTNN